jgi:hypothetical protein
LWATVQRTGGAMAFRRNGGYSVVQSNHKRKARVLSRRTEDESLAKRLRHLPRARVEGARLETGSGAALTQGTVYNRLISSNQRAQRAFIQTSRTSSSGMKTQRLRDPLHDLSVFDTRHLRSTAGAHLRKYRRIFARTAGSRCACSSSSRAKRQQAAGVPSIAHRRNAASSLGLST